HDFNNLLHGILIPLQLAQRLIAEGRFDEIERAVTRGLSAADRAVALTRRLLMFARQQPLEAKPVDIDQLMVRMSDLIREAIGTVIKCDIVSAGDLQVNVDANQLENVLLNLCINARDAMPDGGELMIRATPAPLDEVTAGELHLPKGEYVCLSAT